jgi:hypothetical protein
MHSPRHRCLHLRSHSLADLKTVMKRLPVPAEPHVHIPFHLDGGFSEDDLGRIEFSVRISLRAVFYGALLMNLAVIPVTILWQRLLF